jgi:hypothetical protein
VIGKGRTGCINKDVYREKREERREKEKTRNMYREPWYNFGYASATLPGYSTKIPLLSYSIQVSGALVYQIFQFCFTVKEFGYESK